jgi:threonine dehydratase
MLAPIFEDIVAARELIAPFIPKTPLIRVNTFSELLDCEYYAKLENVQKVVGIVSGGNLPLERFAQLMSSP